MKQYMIVVTIITSWKDKAPLVENAIFEIRQFFFITFTNLINPNLKATEERKDGKQAPYFYFVSSGASWKGKQKSIGNRPGSSY